MKKTVLDPIAWAAMRGRIASLKPDSPALWGQMNAAQCLCHLADQLRMALSQLKVAGEPSFMGRTVMKTLVLMGMPAPKGKIKTFPEIDQRTAGTKPTSFEADRATLCSLIETFIGTPESFAFQRHGFFGKFSKREWGRMAWIHLDHHLRQFGC
jgi:hypothetical protein